MRPKDILKEDPIFSKVVESTSPLKLPKSGNVFNELVKAIAYQQISYKAADTIYGRFIELVGTENYTPSEIINLEIAELRSIGFSNRKAEYSQNIARFFVEHNLLDADWKKKSDQDIINLLTQIKGVGEWTVQMILIFELHRKDVFPFLDLAIQQSMQELYKIKSQKKLLYQDMSSIAENWRPHRTLATLYLWGWKRQQEKIKKGSK